jgi:hypothetical protein
MHRAVAVALAFCLPLPAADLVVEPGNPAAYQTLQAALDAAQPGDRILIAAPLMAGAVVVQKGVTIEPLGGGRQSIAFFGQTGGIHIAALTPGVPFVLRRLDLGLYEMGGPIQGIRTAGTVPGEVHFDEVTVHRAAANQHTIYGGGSLVRLHTTTVWLRQCTLVAHDLMRNNGCIDLDGTQGTDALVVEADTLRLERVALRGSSANHLDYHCCFPNGSSCQGQFAAGGHGGAALRATTRVTLLVDGDLSDGNGGTVGAGPWVVPASGGAAGTSGFGGQTGTLATWATRHEAGLPGHPAARSTSRWRRPVCRCCSAASPGVNNRPCSAPGGWRRSTCCRTRATASRSSGRCPRCRRCALCRSCCRRCGCSRRWASTTRRAS